MRTRTTELFGAAAIACGTLFGFACSGGEDYPSNSGGKPATSTGGSSSTGGAVNTGGVSNTGGGGSSPVAYSQVVNFISNTCAACHLDAEKPNLDDMNPTALYTTLTTTTVSLCGGNKLVTANDPSKSALLMVGTDKCSGLKMPAGCGTPLCFADKDIAMLTSWIQQGAKNQ
jgi:hypothetical protein